MPAATLLGVRRISVENYFGTSVAAPRLRGHSVRQGYSRRMAVRPSILLLPTLVYGIGDGSSVGFFFLPLLGCSPVGVAAARDDCPRPG